MRLLFCCLAFASVYVSFGMAKNVYEDIDETVEILRLATKYKIDAWSNVQLTAEEFFEEYTNLFPKGYSKDFYQHVFRTLDSDNSGRIDIKELILATYISRDAKPEEKLEWAFQFFDVNGDGTIEPSESTEVLGAMNNMNQVPSATPEMKTRAIFAEFDENNDGILSEDEFIRGFLADEFIRQKLTANFSKVKSIRCDVGNGGCQHLCVAQPQRPNECQCRPGFVLRKDGKSCRELDPCEVNKGGCMHKCVSQGGRAVCQCYKGFRLLSDMKTCHDVYEDVEEILGTKHDIDWSDFLVTPEELSKVHTKLYPESKAGRFIKHFFRVADSDKSGRIDSKEIFMAKYNFLFAKSEEKLEWAFKLYDVNGNGTIEPSETTEIIGTFYDKVGPSLTILDPSNTPERRTREFFANVDENSDGVISKDEFFSGCLDDEVICKIITTNFGEGSNLSKYFHP